MVKKIYVIHHSHTDIGYTDFQERVVHTQVKNIKNLASLVTEDFKWNCETFFCVEKFLEVASQAEIEAFFDVVRQKKVGLSGTYLNFTDLVDPVVLKKRTQKFVSFCKEHKVVVDSAMIADINGINNGSLDAYLESGIDFLYTNIHCHHGMYPLRQNQTAYFWKSSTSDKKLLVWNGEHYNLGNALGLTFAKMVNFMTSDYCGDKRLNNCYENSFNNIVNYLKELEDSDYKYSFVPISVSGVFSDNAPANPQIADTIKQINLLAEGEFEIQMCTLSELYEVVKAETKDVPTYSGDLTDWWAFGATSTPYAVKHYLEAVRMQRLNNKLDPEGKVQSEKYLKQYEDYALLFAEHTFGHSATVTDPTLTMVKNLEFRKNSYASLANEGANNNNLLLLDKEGECFVYYGREGVIKSINTGCARKCLVSFYLEVWGFGDIEVKDKLGNLMECQVSSHPRGVLISFYDDFKQNESKEYEFKEIAKEKEKLNTRTSYTGSERIRDIVNTYDPLTYTLPYELSSPYFKLSYKIGTGIISLFDKVNNKELLIEGEQNCFTPIYETTEVRTDNYEERRLFGRNIRGRHSKKYYATLVDIKNFVVGPIFNKCEFVYNLEGCEAISLEVIMYQKEARIDYSLKVSKKLNYEPESLFLPLCLNVKGETWLDKGFVPFRPGIDQIPGSCMEYYLTSSAAVLKENETCYAFALLDSPMVYTGEMTHHPIRLCENRKEDNSRPLYSWIMNNNWETNFSIDLSGITEYRYSLNRITSKEIKDCYSKLEDIVLGTVTMMKENR